MVQHITRLIRDEDVNEFDEGTTAVLDDMQRNVFAPLSQMLALAVPQRVQSAKPSGSLFSMFAHSKDEQIHLDQLKPLLLITTKVISVPRATR